MTANEQLRFKPFDILFPKYPKLVVAVNRQCRKCGAAHDRLSDWCSEKCEKEWVHSLD